MGAYGAALYAKERADAGFPCGGLISRKELAEFVHEVRATTCQGCTNHCSLTINTFSGGRRFIAGNRCDRPLAMQNRSEKYDLYEYKTELLKECCNDVKEEGKPSVGIPLGLNMYELLPFWYAFFRRLGFSVLVSPFSTRTLYTNGQHTIPSDTACYPAKLMHGHIEALLDMKPDAIFYPDMTYNADEHMGVNHYNCPVVAYYPQVLRMNIKKLSETVYIDDFVSISDRKKFLSRMKEILAKYFPKVKNRDVAEATEEAYRAYAEYFRKIRAKADEFMAVAREKKMPMIILAGRPYHLDPEVNHGIHTLITRLGAVVLTEDSVSDRVQPFETVVRNQWTYHARLYSAAKYCAQSKDRINLVQLVSFGCGVDAITTDEVRAILEEKGKIYTQIKIDEISNMGAVTIRLRSLFSAAEDKEKRK